jgi:hypothetical protein
VRHARHGHGEHLPHLVLVRLAGAPSETRVQEFFMASSTLNSIAFCSRTHYTRCAPPGTVRISRNTTPKLYKVARSSR